MMKKFGLRTGSRVEMIDITEMIRSAVKDAGVQEGICCVFIPHTTAAVTINENADPAVQKDIITALERAVPLHAGYAHREGNAAAHVKASLFGASATVFVARGELVLGTWQSVFFCEFDGPRSREVFVRIVPA